MIDTHGSTNFSLCTIQVPDVLASERTGDISDIAAAAPN
jgi:hypothetical protein